MILDMSGITRRYLRVSLVHLRRLADGIVPSRNPSAVMYAELAHLFTKKALEALDDKHEEPDEDKHEELDE